MSPRRHRRRDAAPDPRRLAAAGGGLVLLVLLGSGCADGSPPPGAAARVGGETIRYEELAAYAAASLGDGGSSAEEAAPSAAVLSGLLDQMIEERLLVLLAIDEGLVAAGTDVGPRRALAALLESRAGEPAEAGDPPALATASPEAPGATRAARTAEPGERVVLRQLLLAERETAEAARRELLDGVDFAEVVRRHAAADGRNGGFEGAFARDELPAAYTDLIFSLEPGEVSEVVPADYGYHLFQVAGRAETTGAPSAGAPADADAVRRLVSRARNLYTVEIHEDNLPFDYRGDYLGN